MNRTYGKGLIELVALTYFATFLGLVTVSGFDVMSLAAWKAAAVAAAPAALAALYGAVARFKGDYASPLGTDTREVRVTPENQT